MYIQKVVNYVNQSNVRYLICSTVIFTILVKVAILLYKEIRKRIIASKIPGPRGIFLIGSLSLVIKGPEKVIEELCKIYRTYEKSIIKLWMYNDLYIMLTQPEDIEFILTHPKLQRKAKGYAIYRESVLGEGIFANDDVEKWKKNRKVVTGGLHFAMLKSFIPTFYEEANVLSAILQKKCAESDECDINHPLAMTTLEMIGKTALGVTLNAQNDGTSRFLENVDTIMDTWEYRTLHPWYFTKVLYQRSSVRVKHDRSQKIINEIVEGIIDKKFAELNWNDVDDNNNSEDASRTPKSVIESLLGHYPVMSREQIRNELVTILIAGQDTTTFTNACVIFMLAHHQEIQNKVFEEMQSIFADGDPTRQPTFDDLREMKYLEQVIKETSRLFPAAPMFARRLDEDLRIGQHLCPADSTLAIFPLFVNRSPLYYDNPDEFNPDNFLPEACRGRKPYTYLTFGAGPRKCLGMNYAMLQLKVILSTLIRKNRFLPADRCPTPQHLKTKFSFTFKFVDGCYVKIKRRTP